MNKDKFLSELENILKPIYANDPPYGWCQIVDAVNKIYATPASVEEKGEGECEQCGNKYKKGKKVFCLSDDCPVNIPAPASVKEEDAEGVMLKQEYKKEVDAGLFPSGMYVTWLEKWLTLEREAQKLDKYPKSEPLLPADEWRNPESINETYAKLGIDTSPINDAEKWFNENKMVFGDDESQSEFIDKELFLQYAARDYKSAKGMNERFDLPVETPKEIRDFIEGEMKKMGWAGDDYFMVRQGMYNLAKWLHEYAIAQNKFTAEIRRLNDPQGEGR